MSNILTVSNSATVSSSSPRARRRAANRERILAAALELVVSEGFSSVTLHRVGAATDYTRAALYRYFDSKEALIAALTVNVIHEISEAVARRLAEIDDGPLEMARAAADALRVFAADHPHKYGMLSMLMAESRAVLPNESTAIDALEQALSPLASLLELATSSGLLREGDSNHRATIIFATVHGILQLRKQGTRSTRIADSETLTKTALDALFAGWGAPTKGDMP